MPINTFSDSLLTHQLNDAAHQLSCLLEKIPFGEPLKTRLNAKKTALENNLMQGEDYFQEESVKSAMRDITHRNQYLLPSMLRIWLQQAHVFSIYEKIFFTLSAITLFTVAVFSYEVSILILDDKPRLEATGDAMKDYCTGGLTDQLSGICSALKNGMTAVFNMNEETTVLPAYTGSVTDTINGPVPGNVLQTVSGWINPVGWRDFFTCSRIDDEMKLVGHAYHGSLQHAQAKASNGFPVALSVLDINPNPLMVNMTLMLAMPLFLAGFCIKLQEGGYSPYVNEAGTPYGHFNGFVRFAEGFERNAYAFAGVYGGLGILATITLGILMCHKAISKWQASSAEREIFLSVRKACSLFKEFSPLEGNNITVRPLAV